MLTHRVQKKAQSGGSVIRAAVLNLFLALELEHHLSKSVYSGRRIKTKLFLIRNGKQITQSSLIKYTKAIGSKAL